MDNKEIYEEITKLKIAQAETNGTLEDHGNKLSSIEGKIDKQNNIIIGKEGEGGLIDRIQKIEFRYAAIKWSLIIGIPSIVGYMNYLKMF